MNLGADRLVLEEPFDDPARWPPQEVAAGSIAVVDGALRIAVADDETALSTFRSLPDTVPVMRAGASVTLNATDGSVGLVCAAGTGEPKGIAGTVTTRDTWQVLVVEDGTTAIVAEGALPPQVGLAGGGSAGLAVECAETGTEAGDRVAVWVDDIIVADVTLGRSLGPWDQVGVLGSAAIPPLIGIVDDATVHVGDAYDPAAADPAVLALLERIPDGWRDACVATRAARGSGVLASVICAPAGDAEQAEYTVYESPEALRAAFRQVVADAPEPPTGADCQLGPSDFGWSIPGESFGLLACFENPDQPGGRVIAWTDETLGALGLGVVTGGGYPELYDWWLGAGLDHP
jgi:hypothetical protein